MYKILCLECHEEFKERNLNYEIDYKTNNDLDKLDLSKYDIVCGKLNESDIRRCTNMKLYQQSFAGSEALKKDWFNENCVVCNGTGTFGVAIAEYMLGTIIYLMRNFGYYTRKQEKHIWDKIPSRNSIMGSTILVVGLGDIGMEFIFRAHNLGAKIIGIRKHPENKPEYVDKCGSLDDLDEYIKEADVVCMCLPNIKSTDNVITAKQLSLMKKDAYLINVGRGNCIVLDDLYNCLKNKEIAGASLDVFKSEPLDENHPIWDLDNILITPHVSGNLDLKVSRNRYVDLALHNIDQLDKERKFKSVVDFETGYRKYE